MCRSGFKASLSVFPSPIHPSDALQRGPHPKVEGERKRRRRRKRKKKIFKVSIKKVNGAETPSLPPLFFSSHFLPFVFNFVPKGCQSGWKKKSSDPFNFPLSLLASSPPAPPSPPPPNKPFFLLVGLSLSLSPFHVLVDHLSDTHSNTHTDRILIFIRNFLWVSFS